MSAQAEENEGYSQAYHEVRGRNISALLNPRPVVIIGVFRDKANFTTVAWTTPISHKPPMLAVALRQSSKSYQMIAEAKSFSLNTVDSSSLELVKLCGNQSGNKIDKDAPVEYRLHQGSRAVPVLTCALSFLNCTLESMQDTGDHGLILASVEDAWTRSPLDGGGKVHSVDSLLCVDHDLFTIADKDYS